MLIKYEDSNRNPAPYLPDMKTASYCPRPAAAIRCFNLLREGRTSKAGGSARKPFKNIKIMNIPSLKRKKIKMYDWTSPGYPRTTMSIADSG
jgi:hypothetical protein